MKTIKLLSLITILFLSKNSFCQELNHIKQCFVTADIVNPSTKKIIKTETYTEVCVKFISENSAKIWIKNTEFDIAYSNNELLERDENGFLIYRATSSIGEIKIEIVYLVGKDNTHFVSLILLYNVPYEEKDNRVILQYKNRNN